MNAAIAAHDYVAAEKVLIDAIERAPRSPHAASLLAYLGSVYFLNQDYLNAAVAWKKADAITPLASGLRFSLAMSYIRIGHADWARPVLTLLSAQEPRKALYPYWLGRLDYDAHLYPEATRGFQRAISLDPTMARAYDNLGLCYFYQNQNALALENFNQAIDLDRKEQHPAAWPFVNRAATLEFLGRALEAEADLREALRIDPQVAQAHYLLGNLLQKKGALESAVQEELTAARLDAQYAEPHVALSRLYNQMGRKAASDKELKIYLSLHAKENTPKQ